MDARVGNHPSLVLASVVQLRAILHGAHVRVVRDCPQAQYLPSRCHFALARLLAFAASRFRSPAAPHADRVVHALDRDQSAVENYGVAIWFVVTLACYLMFLLPFRAPFDILAAIVLAPLSVQLAIPFFGGIFT